MASNIPEDPLEYEAQLESINKQIDEVKKDIKDLSGYTSDTPFNADFIAPVSFSDFSEYVYFGNLPVGVPADKHDKLKFYMSAKIISKIVPNFDSANITLSVNENGATTGCAFVRTPSPAHATAVLQLDGQAFDPRHTMIVCPLNDVMDASGDGTLPPLDEPAEVLRSPEDWSWLQDDRSRDQFVVRFHPFAKVPGEHYYDDLNQKTEVLWAEQDGAPLVVTSGEEYAEMGRIWCAGLVGWSPRGTFLYSYGIDGEGARRGIKTFHGSDFEEGQKFEHFGTHQCIWSPDERYLATWSGGPNNYEADRAFIIWDARTGKEIKAFPQYEQHEVDHGYTWSADSKFIAKKRVLLRQNGQEVPIVEVREADREFALVGDASIQVKGKDIMDLQFAPDIPKTIPRKGAAATHVSNSGALLAWWSPAWGNDPAQVSVMRLPSKEYIRSRPMQDVGHISLTWHPEGNFIAVAAEKLTRAQVARRKAMEAGTVSKASTAAPRSGANSYAIEIFDFRSRDVHVGVLDVQGRVHTLAWEPSGTRFAVICAEGVKHKVIIFSVGERGVITKVAELADRAVSSLHWSPQGGILVLAGLEAAHSGTVEFYDADRNKTLNTINFPGNDASGIDWDPTGRSVAIYKCQPLEGHDIPMRTTVNNGYMIVSFQGVPISPMVDKNRMYQFVWRPRPKGLLTDEQVENVRSNLKKFIAEYEAEDKKRQERVKLLDKLRVHKKLTDLRSRVAQAKKHVAALVGPRQVEIPPGAEVVVETVELTLSEKVVSK